VTIDDSWLPNDGLVNNKSSRFPFNERSKPYDAQNIERGIWQVMPELTNWDHNDFGGGMDRLGGAEGFKDFYFAIAELLENLPK